MDPDLLTAGDGVGDSVRCVGSEADVETEKADFSPDGKLLAGYWKDNLVRIWDATDGAEVKTLELPSEDLHALVFTCDSRRLVTSSGTQIIVWDIVN